LVNGLSQLFDGQQNRKRKLKIKIRNQRLFFSPSTLDILRAQVYCSSWILSALIIQVDPSIEVR